MFLIIKISIYYLEINSGFSVEEGQHWSPTGISVWTHVD